MNKKPSIHKVAEAAGVSLATVSQTFRNPKRVGEDIRKKVLQAAEELGYIPKFIKKRSAYGNVGLLIDIKRGPFGEFYGQIIIGILQQAEKLKWNISIETYDSTVKNKLPPMITEKKVDGVILLSKQEDVFIQKLIQHQVPYCVVDYTSEKLKHNYVISDWYTGAYLATEYLLKRGHRLIAMVHSPLDKGKASLERVAGFNQAMDDYKIQYLPGYMVNGEFSYVKAYEVCRDLLKRKPVPTAIFCATDVMALGVYKAVKEAGYQIPKDISVIGFDNIDYPYFMDQPDPPLTTINIDKYSLGAEALKIVHSLIVHEPEITLQKILPVKLVEKGSVRKVS